MRSGNPVLNDRSFPRADRGTTDGLMTIEGTVNKTMLLLTICVATAAWTWGRFFSTGSVESISTLMWVGVLGGLVLAVVTAFKPVWAKVTAPAYAALEGLAIGGISAFFESKYPGIVIQAVGLTFGTLLCLLGVYKSRLIAGPRISSSAWSRRPGRSHCSTWCRSSCGCSAATAWGSSTRAGSWASCSPCSSSPSRR